MTHLPIDVSREMLAASGDDLAAELAERQIQCLWGRYEAGLAYLRDRRDHCDEPAAVAFLGSNLGNATADDRFLVSADLQKPQRCSTSATTTRPTGRRSPGSGSPTSPTSTGASAAASTAPLLPAGALQLRDGRG